MLSLFLSALTVSTVFVLTVSLFWLTANIIDNMSSFYPKTRAFCWVVFHIVLLTVSLTIIQSLLNYGIITP